MARLELPAKAVSGVAASQLNERNSAHRPAYSPSSPDQNHAVSVAVNHCCPPNALVPSLRQPGRVARMLADRHPGYYPRVCGGTQCGLGHIAI